MQTKYRRMCVTFEQSHLDMIRAFAAKDTSNPDISYHDAVHHAALKFCRLSKPLENFHFTYAVSGNPFERGADKDSK